MIMHMAIRHYRVPAGQVDEVVRRVDDLWLERARRLPGFISYYVTKGGGDRLTSVMVFAEEEQIEKAVEASAEWVGASLMDQDVEFLEMWQGEVVVHGGA
jgi:heme-degrading monooxygenase HmoA